MVERVDKALTTAVVWHGPGALGQLAGEIAKLGGQRVGIITDPGVAKAGLLERVAKAAGGVVFSYAEVVPEPSYELAGVAATFLRENRCDLVIGLGGGSSIDVAKMAALLMTNPGDASDYFGLNKVPQRGLPVIAIPTTAGTGSETSPASVFVDPRDHTKKGVRSDFVLPAAAILDPLLTLSLPQALTASTGIDALTHAIECYTALAATVVSDMAAEKGMELVGAHLRTAYSNGQDLAARQGMLMGSYIAGISLAIANVGAAHGLAQAMGGLHHVPHGVANALFLPYVMEFNRMACQAKYARVAALLGERVEGLSQYEAALKAVEAVRRLTLDLHLPQHLREVGVPEDGLDALAQRCLETQGRVMNNNPRTVNLAEAREILRRAY
jgi:alcohol dehydrogenase